MRNTRRPVALAAAPLLALAILTAQPAAAETFQVKLGPQTAQIFRGHAKVAIPSYQLTFITSQQATAVATIGARTRLAMVLAGVDEATMRKLTDAAYADLRAQFEAAGVPVIGEAETQALVAAAGLERVPGNVEKGGGGPGITIGKSLRSGFVSYGARGAPALMAYRAAPPSAGGFAGAMANMNGMAGAKMAMPAWNLDANLVMPAITLDFANMSADTGSDFLGRAKAEVGGQVAFVVRAGSTVSVLNPMNGGRGASPVGLRQEKDAVSPTVFATVEKGGAPVRVGSMTAIADDNYQMVARARGDAVIVNLPVWEGLVRDAYRSYNAALVAAVVKATRK